MATTQHTIIVGVFANRIQAEQARRELLGAGCSQEQIKSSMEHLAQGQAIASSTAPRNALIRDAALGGGIGALPGIGVAFLARKLNASLASRPLWLILSAGAAIGTLLGSVAGLLTGKRLSSNQAGQNEASPARVLISVETENPQAILDILRRNGADQVHTTTLPGGQVPQASNAAQAPAQTGAVPESGAAFGGVQNPPYASALETTQPPSLVVGTFPNHATANTAIDALLEAGFTSEQIRYSERGTEGGGILNHLIRLGVPSQVAQPYERDFKTGHTIVTVKTTDRQPEAQFLMANHGGANIRLFSAAPASPSTPPLEAMQEIKLREEQLRVSKQQMQTGEVDIRKETVTEEKTITVPVTREEMVIEYRPAAGQNEATPAIDEAGEGQETIRIPLSEEQVQVTKQTVQTGEVSIHKQQVQDIQHITETVQREELQVEHQGDVQIKDIAASNRAEQG